MFNMFKKKSAEVAKKYSGQTDFLEAVCAAAALIAIADGEIEASEEDALLKAIAANAMLQQGFDARKIEEVAASMLSRAKGGRMGRSGLRREITESVDKNPEWAGDILLAALDVAEGDGQIEPAEMVVLESLAAELRVDLKRLMAA